MGWAEAETKDACLPDIRLKRRLARVLERSSAQPTASIPGASGTWADTKAAYRLFDNDRVDAADVLDGHGCATFEPAGGQFCRRPAVDRLVSGPLGNRGVFSHPRAGVSDRRPPAGNRPAVGAVHRGVLGRRLAAASFDADRTVASDRAA